MRRIKNFPLLKILEYKFENTYFEIILISLNDTLVNMYLNNSIKYITIHEMIIKLLKNRYFTKYYEKSPKNINDIKNMVNKVENYLHKYFKNK